MDLRAVKLNSRHEVDMSYQAGNQKVRPQKLKGRSVVMPLSLVENFGEQQQKRVFRLVILNLSGLVDYKSKR